VRIRAKRLRYALDACASLFPAKRVKPFASALSELQDALGDANDARVGRALLAELRVPRALAGTGVAALDQAEARATRRALPALERLRAAPKPWGKG
jgi:CHAD domain-containing protein